MRLERWSQAEEAFLETLKYDVNDFSAYYHLARLSVRKNDNEKAKENLSQALKLNASHLGARYLLARCHVQDGNPMLALAELDQAEAKTPVDHPMMPAIKNLKDQIRRVPVPR